MEPRDDFDRAGGSLRRRATDLARGHDADEVTRLARRRRVWQGATAGVATLAIVFGLLNGLPEPSVDRITVEPLTPSEAAPSAAPTPEPTTSGASAYLDATGPTLCDGEDLAPRPPQAIGDAIAESTAAPSAIADAALVASDEHLFALRQDGPAAFAVLEPGQEWQCLPSPDLAAPRLAVAGGNGAVLALGRDEALLFDPATQRWSRTRVTPFEATPLAGTWTDDRYVVVFAPQPGEGSRVAFFDPVLRHWGAIHAAPFAVSDPASTRMLWDGDRVILVGNAPPAGDSDASEVQGRLAVVAPTTRQWEVLPDWPKQQVADALLVGDRLVAVDERHRTASFDFETETWSESSPTGTDNECSSQLATDGRRLLVVGCHVGAVSDDVGRTWEQFDIDGAMHSPTTLGDGTVVAWRGLDGATELVAIHLDEQITLVAATVQCSDVAEFGTRLADTGIAADEAAPTTPDELADDVDLVVAGTLTGEVEVANGPGPAGESYLAYELEVTEVVAGDVAVGETVRVSIAFDGDPTRSAELAGDVPAGTSVAAFAYEVTDAPGGWVAADGNGFAVACDGGPPLGLVGDGAAWSGLDDLGALVDAARR